MNRSWGTKPVGGEQVCGGRIETLTAAVDSANGEAREHFPSLPNHPELLASLLHDDVTAGQGEEVQPERADRVVGRGTEMRETAWPRRIAGRSQRLERRCVWR